MKLARRLAAVAVAAAGALAVSVTAPAYAAPDDPVSIPDAALRACIAGELGVSESATYTEGQLASLFWLSCNGVGDLAGLEHAVNLEQVSLPDGTIDDVSPIATIQSIGRFDLSNNNISDVTPFKSRSTTTADDPMTLLDLDGNKVSDLSFFTYRYILHASLEAKSQSVTVPTVAIAGTLTPIPVKGDGVTKAPLQLTLPSGVTRSGNNLIYSTPGTYTINFKQNTDWDDENGVREYFSGTFTQTVTAATAITPATPRISGTTRVGSRLTAVPGTWQPSGVSLKYQWLRNGTAIAKATASTYTLTASDLGKRISVRVTGSKTGLPTVARTSAQTALISKGILGAKTPSISGTAKKGKTLTVKMNAWTPAPVKITYRWLRNGSAISGATKSSYKLVKKDKKKRISVRVTGSKTGYTTVSRTSAQTAKVK